MSIIFDKTQILKITNYKEIFKNCKIKEDIQKIFRLYVKYWHPDVINTGDNDVFCHLNKLYNEALNNIRELKTEIFTRQDKSQVKVNYYNTIDFELGKILISDTIVGYILNIEKYYLNFIAKINNLKYANDKMKEEFIRYLPNVLTHFKSIDNKYIIIIQKPKDALNLYDILNNNITLDNKHVMWIISRLYNLCSFLYYNKLSHNDISLHNCFITPESHGVLLLGGWWYSTYYSENLIGCNKSIYNIMSKEVKNSKISKDSKLDLDSLRAVGGKLIDKKSIPDCILRWLKYPSSNNAINEFTKWDKVLIEGYGPKKFIKLELTANDIYW